MEICGFVWEKKASFSSMERVNLPKNGDMWICMGEKGFNLMLERVNLPKNGDIWICMGEKGFNFMLERVNLPKNGDICICMGEKGFIFIHGSWREYISRNKVL